MDLELEIKSLCKSFGEKEVLKNISFTAQGGSALGLLGRNGAGKTTTIRIIMGVFFADSGEVLMDGKPVDRRKIRIGYMPEERGLYPKKQIAEQLVYLAVLRGMTKNDAKKACDRWLERMGMSEYKNKKLETLSKGNQQKIQLAATLMCDPQIVILDEPFSGLDPVNAMILKDVIKEMIAGGSVVLFSSHQMNYIEEFCDSIAILNGGQIVLSGELRQIKRQYPRNKLKISSLQADAICAELGQKCARREDGSLLVTMDSPGDKAAFMTSLARKYDIDDMGVFEPSLNDIFVEYTAERA